MSKRTFVIVVLLLIAIIVAVAWYLVFGSQSAPISVPINSSPNTNLFPFGTGPATGTPAQNNGQTRTSTSSLPDIGGGVGNGGNYAAQPRLRQISFVPTAGAVAFNFGSTTIVRYIERATGHVYETDDSVGASKASSTATEISAITIPKIHDALWSSDGKRLVIQYLKDDNQTVRTFAAQVSTTTTPDKALQGSFLADDIRNIAVYGTKLFYLASTAGAGEQGVSASLDGTSKTDIFDSSFGDWTARWSSAGVIALYPRPSAAAEGGLYLLDPATGAYPLALNGVSGLSGLASSDGSLVFYSGTNGSSVGSGIYDVKKDSRRVLDINTLSEKCVWSKKQKAVIYCAVPNNIPSATYPDDWYKGKVSFNDSIWQIDASTGETTDIADPELDVGVSMDIVNMNLDQNESVLLFTNRDDMTVWSYRLTE